MLSEYTPVTDIYFFLSVFILDFKIQVGNKRRLITLKMCILLFSSSTSICYKVGCWFGKEVQNTVINVIDFESSKNVNIYILITTYVPLSSKTSGSCILQLRKLYITTSSKDFFSPSSEKDRIKKNPGHPGQMGGLQRQGVPWLQLVCFEATPKLLEISSLQ